MAIGTVHNCVPNGSYKMAIIEDWLCKIYDDGYAECELNMRVFSTLAYWNSTSGGYRYGTWNGVTMPGILTIDDKTNKPFTFGFVGGSQDAYINSFVLHTNYTKNKTPSVTGYTVYAVGSQIPVDHYWSVKGFFDFSGKEIKWI